MKNSEFKYFKEDITKSGKDAAVWYVGYMWLYLTARQHKEIYDILLTKPFLKEELFNNHLGIEIPSGLFIIKEGSNNHEN